MGRPPLALGDLGSIRTYGWHGGKWQSKATLPEGFKPTKWKAIANYRGYDGITSPIERHGPTEAKAKAALNAEVRNRAGKRSAMSTHSRLREFADIWLEEATDRLAATSLAKYRIALNKHVLPALGELRISEIRVSLLEEYFRGLRSTLGAGARRNVRTILKQIMDIPVRRDLIEYNPVSAVSRITGSAARAPRALTGDEVLELLHLIDADELACRADLPDLLRVMLGTGMRIGEACGLRWCDVILGPTAEDSMIQITGNAVPVPGVGVVRHDGKTFASQRNVPMPAFLHTLLAVRRPEDAADDDPVFPNRSNKLKNPHTFQHALLRARRRIAPREDPHRWDWLVSHTLRKTTATQLDEGGATAREIADILGHVNPALTQRVYLGRGRVNMRAAHLLDAAYRRPDSTA